MGKARGSEDLAVGQLLNTKQEVSLLKVCTVDEVTELRTITSPLREVENNTMYEGDRKVLVRGTDGTERVQLHVTSVNGQVAYEEVLSSAILQEATETVVEVGTLERPLYYSTGSFQWPTQGRITSEFGYRNIFGGSSFHSGLDIANSYGTSIYAADSGVVTYVGYQGSYGNLVVIDHGNGLETYYSHCATLSVTEGQGITKGEFIATMGSTGRATGNHCHFEVRSGGVAVNPKAYLP